MRFPTPRPYVSDRLKASGNLSYQDFLRLIEKMWTDGHPDIPFRASGPDLEDATYPAIVYRSDMYKPHPAEPKPRYREEIITGANEDAIIIAAQRFQCVLTFVVMAQMNPQQAETIREVFEDFILEYTGVFKELGLSDLFYARRLPDGLDERPGLGIVERSVSYLVTFEKHVITQRRKLDQIMADARIYLSSNQYNAATPNFNDGITITITDEHSTPNF